MPKMGPSKRRSASRGATGGFNSLSVDPTRSDFLNPRTPMISTDFDGDDGIGSHPTTLPPTWSNSR